MKSKKISVISLLVIVILFFVINPPIVFIGDNIVFAYKTKYNILEYDSSIKHLKNTHELSLNFDFHSTDSYFDLNFLNNMKKLKNLSLNVNPEYTDFKPVALCENLTAFKSEFGIDDLSFLSDLIELRSIEINPYSYPVSNINFVRNLKKLEYLSLPLDGNADYSILEELPYFTSIEIGGECGDLTRLLNNKKLEYVSLRTETADLGVANIENNIKYLSCYSTKDMSFLKYFSKLENLILFQKFDGTVDLSALKSNEHLENFKLASDTGINCNINLSDLTELSSLKNITLVNINILDKENIINLKKNGVVIKVE